MRNVEEKNFFPYKKLDQQCWKYNLNVGKNPKKKDTKFQFFRKIKNKF